MTWVRTEDDMPLHPKMLRLSDGAYRLWSNGLHFANRAVTDGKISKELLPSLNHHGRWTSKQLSGFVAELVGVLWIDSGDHFQIHDYAHFQAEAMKDRVERKREIDRDKKRTRRGNLDGVPSRVPEGQTQGHTEGSPREISVPSRPVPSRPVESASALSAPTAVSAFDRAARGSAQMPPEMLSRVEVARGFSEMRVDAKRGSWRSGGWRDDERLDALAEWANAEGTCRVTRVAALADAIRGFLADTSERVTNARWSVAYFTDPGAYMASWRKAHPANDAAPPATPLAGLKRERSRLAAFHGTSAFLVKSPTERIASIERLEAVEREIAAMEKAS